MGVVSIPCSLPMHVAILQSCGALELSLPALPGMHGEPAWPVEMCVQRQDRSMTPQLASWPRTRNFEPRLPLAFPTYFRHLPPSDALLHIPTSHTGMRIPTCPLTLSSMLFPCIGSFSLSIGYLFLATSLIASLGGPIGVWAGSAVEDARAKALASAATVRGVNLGGWLVTEPW